MRAAGRCVVRALQVGGRFPCPYRFPSASPDRTATILDELARATDRPRSYLIVKALDAYLAEYADYQVALDRLRDRNDPVISGAELRKRLGGEN